MLSLLVFPFCFNSILLSADYKTTESDKLDHLISKALMAAFHCTLFRMPGFQVNDHGPKWMEEWRGPGIDLLDMQ